MIGRIFGNRYEIVELLGGGGMAQVFKGWDRSLQRAVTVKILRENLCSDEEFVRRFQREAQAVAGLSHPNIVNVYDVGREGKTDYIVMEFIDGPTLKEVIRSRAPLPPEEAVELAKQICDALEHAHERGIIHRDIKPHNILITRTGRVKVTDFGIARSIAQNTMTMDRSIVGSVHYLSPEQARGLPVDEKSDIYALGVVMYELLSGQLPFQGETPIAVALQQIQEQPQALSVLNHRVPPALEQVVLRAMEKEPARRYGNARAFRQDLERVFTGQVAGRLPHADDDSPTVRLDGAAARIDAELAATERKEEGKGARRADPGKGKRSWGVWAAGLLTAVLLLASLTFAWTRYMSVPEVTVPKVKGIRVTEAIERLEKLGLRAETNYVFDNANAHMVIAQDPDENQVVKQNRVVKLTVSQGPKLIRVPNVTGKALRDAQVALKEANFTVSAEEVFDENPVGTVLSQSPAANSEQPGDTVIQLRVSKGPEVKATMPSLVGSKLQEAQAKLEPLKIDLKLKLQENATLPPWTILAQEPSPNAPLKPGDPVTLTYCIPPANASPAGPVKSSVRVFVPNDGKEHMVRIVFLDEQGGQKELYHQRHKAGEIVSQEVATTGRGTVQAYVDQMVYWERKVE
ncbi:Stk1 family PASTA domain-containing Ser/Thr kinase [Heliomicrobium modesticaldum]|nr:Stk1 family PASTA domain-containing Ser/Thr kinase [Heliomicrobium modesticaldum]